MRTREYGIQYGSHRIPRTILRILIWNEKTLS